MHEPMISAWISTRARILLSPLFWLGMAAGGLYLFHLCNAVLAERALYTDGAVFFTGLLARDFPWPWVDDPKHIRLFVNYINQFPVVLAIKAGVEDLRTLKLLFGGALFFIPVIIYLACFLVCRRARDHRMPLFIAASFISCAIPSEIYIVNQSFTTLALCWLLLCYVLLDFKVNALDRALIIAVLLALFKSHEGMVLWGAVLFCAAGARLWRCRWPGILKDHWHIPLIGLIGLLHAAFVLYWQATHPVGEQTQTFLNDLAGFLPERMWTASGATRISHLAGISLVSSFIVIWFRGRMTWLPKFSMAILTLCWGIALFCAYFSLDVAVLFRDEPWWIRPWYEKSYRFLINFGSVFWMGMAIFFWWTGARLSRADRSLIQFILVAGLIAGCIWQLGNTESWKDFQNQSALILENSEEPFIPTCKVKERFSEMERVWLYHNQDPWVWPAYAIAIQNARLVSKIIVPENHLHMLQIYEKQDDDDGFLVIASFVYFFPDGYFDFSELIRAYQAYSPAIGSAEVNANPLASEFADQCATSDGTVMGIVGALWFGGPYDAKS